MPWLRCFGSSGDESHLQDDPFGIYHVQKHVTQLPFLGTCSFG